MLRHFYNKSINEKDNENNIQKIKTFFPLKMQAYERAILFLERIDPNNMIIRTHKSGMKASDLHRELLKIIREEYTHNMSQQIYIDQESWKTLLNAKDETIQIINISVNNLNKESSGLDLSAKIFEHIGQNKISPTESARNSIVEEFQRSVNK
jgi:hypothetical protein